MLLSLFEIVSDPNEISKISIKIWMAISLVILWASIKNPIQNLVNLYKKIQQYETDIEEVKIIINVLIHFDEIKEWIDVYDSHEREYTRIKYVKLYKKIQFEMINEGTLDPSLDCQIDTLHILFDKKISQLPIMDKFPISESQIKKRVKNTINSKFADSIRSILKSEQAEFISKKNELISKQEFSKLVTFVRNSMIEEQLLDPNLEIDFDELHFINKYASEKVRIDEIYNVYMSMQQNENEKKNKKKQKGTVSKIYKNYKFTKSIPVADSLPSK